MSYFRFRFRFRGDTYLIVIEKLLLNTAGSHILLLQNAVDSQILHYILQLSLLQQAMIQYFQRHLPPALHSVESILSLPSAANREILNLIASFIYIAATNHDSL